MSHHQPALRPHEAWKPGREYGVHAHVVRSERRYQQVRRARKTLRCDQATAERVAFVTWLVEMQWLSDDPRVPPLRVWAACSSDSTAWWDRPGHKVEIRVPAGHGIQLAQDSDELADDKRLIRAMPSCPDCGCPLRWDGRHAFFVGAICAEPEVQQVRREQD